MSWKLRLAKRPQNIGTLSMPFVTRSEKLRKPSQLVIEGDHNNLRIISLLFDMKRGLCYNLDYTHGSMIWQ